MREVTEKNIALEKKKQEQMEVIAKLTKEFNDHLKEQAELRKEAAKHEGRGGTMIWNAAEAMKEGVEKFTAQQEQGMRGELSINLEGIADQKIKDEVAKAVTLMNRDQKNQNDAAGGAKWDALKRGALNAASGK
jgi:hypothetical protein